MKSSVDPLVHRQRERQFIEHVEKLLDDERLRVDTTRGRRPVTSMIRNVNRSDRGVELKRVMAAMNRPDRELEKQMPVGESLEVTLSHTRWLVFRLTVGRIKVMCLSPVSALLAGESPQPLTAGDVRRILSEIPPPLGGVPTTVVLMSTGGFTLEAHEAIERRSDRTLILAEPNEAGGWTVSGPPETQALTELFDPEAEDQKRQRVREAVEADRLELTGSGIAGDRLAGRLQVPLQLVENELQSYAKQNPGLTAKRLDGRVVLFRSGAVPAASAAAGPGGDMPFLERMRSLFSNKGENEKKVALLSERRAALSQQRDRSYEELGAMEEKESSLREQFKQSDSALAKRRLTSQLLQLRKDIERRQQLMGMLNQQINVVSTHLHNLELVQQGKSAQLPDSEELTADAAAAEDVLAQLEADAEVAGVVGTIAQTGMSAEEQALFEELEREASGESGAAPGTKIELETVEGDREQRGAAAPRREGERGAQARRPERSEPEAG
jgi:hypothetical protein